MKSTSADFPERLPSRLTRNIILDALKFDRNGLITIVAQEKSSKKILLVAHANREALEATLNTGLMHYYSRSRKKLWKKGEESGHIQWLVDLTVDCDGDAIVARVSQVKGCCHRGFRSCFSYQIQPNGTIKVVGKKVFDPAKVYSRHKTSARKRSQKK